MTVSARTRLAGVIGHPVAHSLSPAIHNAALRHAGIDAVYLAFDVPAERFESAVRGLGAAGVAGLNVTVPHKQAALGVADLVSADAERAGAANTLVFERMRTVAHNTDVAGFGRALADLGVDPSLRRCVVLGAGGAARASVMCLVESSWRVTIVNRTVERAREVARELGAEVAEWAKLDEAVQSADLIVNATSLGLDGSSVPLDASQLRNSGASALMDMVYAPGETALVHRAREAGLKASDGLGMLVHQAGAAFRLLWGIPAPTGVMLSAALEASGRA